MENQKMIIAEIMHELWFKMYNYYDNPLFKIMDNEEKRQFKRCEKTLFDIYKKLKYHSNNDLLQ